MDKSTLIPSTIFILVALISGIRLIKAHLRTPPMTPAAICLGDGWQSMENAPRDGTVIELCNTYGIAPWYGLHRWTKEQVVRDQEGKEFPFTLANPTWVDVQEEAQSVEDGPYLHWRPYTGDPASYVDPTNGAQKTDAYWVKAAGR